MAAKGGGEVGDWKIFAIKLLNYSLQIEYFVSNQSYSKHYSTGMGIPSDPMDMLHFMLKNVMSTVFP